MTMPTIRFRVDFGEACAIGPGKIALLEAIHSTGSLSQAARDLKMSYRRGWLLLDSLNRSFRRPVAALSTGGRGGGGARLTPFGTSLVAVYRKLEADIAKRARVAFGPVARNALRVAAPHVARRRLQKHARRRAA